MSITDELRDWAHGFTEPYKRNEQQLLAIADRIDAEHERQCAESWMRGHDAWAAIDRSDEMAEHGWIRLPKDADGEPIRVGERVQLIGNDPSTVSHMSLADDGWRVYVKYDGGIGTGSGEPKRIRHHHEPTVEDVLREFADEMNQNLGMYTGEAIDADEWRDADNKTISKYAKRLTLAEGEE